LREKGGGTGVCGYGWVGPQERDHRGLRGQKKTPTRGHPTHKLGVGYSSGTSTTAAGGERGKKRGVVRAALVAKKTG